MHVCNNILLAILEVHKFYIKFSRKSPNRFATVWVIDQPIRSFPGFLGARNTMVQIVLYYKYVCVVFYVNFNIICNITTT